MYKRMHYLVGFLFIFSILFEFFINPGSTYAIDLSHRSQKEIRGCSPESGIHFRAQYPKEKLIKEDLEFNGKRVIVQIGDGKKEKVIKINSYVIESGEVARLTSEDSDILKQFLSSMLKENIGHHWLGKMFLRTLNLLYSWPLDQPIGALVDDSAIFSMIDTYHYSSPPIKGYSHPGACDWPPPIDLSENLCFNMNQEHGGEYINYGNFIGSAQLPYPPIPIFYPVSCQSFNEIVGPYPFEYGDCFGRCGKGCIGDGTPNNTVNIFTQNCFNHDGCCDALGLIHPYCNQMFLYCINDFFFGPYPKLPDTGQTQSYTDTFGDDSDYTINPPSYTDNGDGTVSDNVTCLMWQQEDDDTRRTWDEACSYCNNLTLAAYSDWRLPSKKELMSIVDYGTYDPAIDSTYFSGTNSSSYWSATTSAGHSSHALDISFYSGIGSLDDKSDNGRVRCVRGQELNYGNFTDNGDGTVTDNYTGLMWQQEEGGSMNWEDAITYCEDLSLAGYTDWRLPNIKELESITDDILYDPAIDTNYFPNAHASRYWSSTTDAKYSSHAWYVEFYDGYVSVFSSKSRDHYVQCVRGGQ